MPEMRRKQIPSSPCRLAISSCLFPNQCRSQVCPRFFEISMHGGAEKEAAAWLEQYKGEKHKTPPPQTLFPTDPPLIHFGLMELRDSVSMSAGKIEIHDTETMWVSQPRYGELKLRTQLHVTPCTFLLSCIKFAMCMYFQNFPLYHPVSAPEKYAKWGTSTSCKLVDV
jgi:hypothetical protein